MEGTLSLRFLVHRRCKAVSPIDILITGGTGFIGGHLIPALIARGHRVRVLARENPPSASLRLRPRLSATCLRRTSVERSADGRAIRVIHLVGTPHPTPSKADQFEKVDLVSIRATVAAARRSAISHLVYVSVAQPAPVMRAYLWVRTLGETMIS